MQNERGFALLIALVIAVILSLLCLSLTLSSLKELQIGGEFENHEKALLAADAGYNWAKQHLRGKDIDKLLTTATSVSFPTTDPSNTVAEWASRNPISPFQARTIDFSSTTSGSSSLTGVLTGPSGQTILTAEDCPAGTPCARFFARVSDNNDGDNDLTKDADGTVYMRVVGIFPNSISENGQRRNSVAVIESELHRDTTFDMTAPLSLISQQVTARFDGNSFLVDGYDHTGLNLAQLNGHKDDTLTPFSAISCLYDNPGLGDAHAAENNIETALEGNQNDNVVGEGGKPSVNDDTIDVKNSPNPDAENIFDPAYLMMIANQVSAVADYKFPTGTETETKFSGGQVLGTVDDPKITYVKGDLDISGNCSGAGILVVTGNLKGNGGFDFQGLALVLGAGSVDFGGANKTFLGGIVVANITPGTPPVFGKANLAVSGKSEFYFAGDKIRLAVSLLPMKRVSWREITPEIEPVVTTTTAQTVVPAQ